MNISMPAALLLTCVGLAAGGMTAWADVKSDIAVVQEKADQNEKKYDQIDDKLDKIIDHLLKKESRNDVGE